MEVISHDILKLQGDISLKQITFVALQTKKNEHGTLIVKGIPEDISSFETQKLNVEISLTGLDGEAIFSGMLEKILVIQEKGLAYFELHVVSATKQLDLKKKKRSFLDTKETYQDIAKAIVSEYDGGSVIANKDCGAEAIKVPIIQYNETDWEFLKRIASYSNGSILADTTKNVPELWFGFPEGTGEATFSMEKYRMGIDGSHSLYAEKEQFEFTYFETESYANFQVGDSVTFEDTKYLIYEKSALFQAGEMIFAYRFGGNGLGLAPSYFNSQFSGLSLFGTVQKTKEELVTVQLEIDEKSDGYEYPWRPETGNILYAMPQVGTKVVVYFPNANEQNAIVINALRTVKDLHNQMGDTSQKIFGTEHKKEISLREKDMNVKSKAGWIQLNDSGGALMQSNDIFVLNGSKVDVEAMSIDVNTDSSAIYIVKGKDGSVDSSVTLENIFNFKGKTNTTFIGIPGPLIPLPTIPVVESKLEFASLTESALGAVVQDCQSVDAFVAGGLAVGPSGKS